MSLSSLVYMGICWGMYKLGGFNERYPGELTRRLRNGWLWLWDWLNKAG